MGNADLKANFNGKKHELNCSTYQVRVFSDCTSLGVSSERLRHAAMLRATSPWL